MGTYDTKEEAKERLKQVEYFKHKNESINDDFKLHYSLKEDIPTFWEWLDDQGLDPDVIEENPDLEEYFRQQYDITYNFKTPEDYDLLDTDVPDDYDDFDFYHEEKKEPLGYHFVCYYEDDDSPGDQTGDAETLEDAIKMCKGYIDKYDYDNAEIFGPKGDTVATFWEGKWNTDYNESLTEEDELKFSPNYDPAGTPLGKGTGLGEDYYDEENEVMIYSCPNCGADLEWLGTQGKYEEYKCPECGEYFYDESGNLINSAELDESLNEGARSGIHQMTLRLMLLNELKKNPDYKDDPRWEEFSDIYDNIDAAIKDTNDELRDLRQDRKWESLGESVNKEDLPEEIFLDDWIVEDILPGLNYDKYERINDDDELQEIREKLTDVMEEDYGIRPYDFYWHLNPNNSIEIYTIVWFDPDEETNESLTESVIKRDMDTLKTSDLSKAPVGSILKIKLGNVSAVDSYLKVDGDN